MIVLDASALMAYILNEPGAQIAKNYLDGDTIINAVNLTESLLKLEKYGQDAQAILLDIRNYDITIIEYTMNYIDDVLNITNPKNMFLSLGDRICLATAISKKCPVLTADASWKKLKLPVEVIAIR